VDVASLEKSQAGKVPQSEANRSRGAENATLSALNERLSVLFGAKALLFDSMSVLFRRKRMLGGVGEAFCDRLQGFNGRWQACGVGVQGCARAGQNSAKAVAWCNRSSSNGICVWKVTFRTREDS
jgi:hypothetical protein